MRQKPKRKRSSHAVFVVNPNFEPAPGTLALRRPPRLLDGGATFVRRDYGGFSAVSGGIAPRRTEHDLEQGPPSPRPSPPGRGGEHQAACLCHGCVNSSCSFSADGGRAAGCKARPNLPTTPQTVSLSLGERVGVRADSPLTLCRRGKVSGNARPHPGPLPREREELPDNGSCMDVPSSLTALIH